MAGVNRRISAASARSHTRKSKQKTAFTLPPGLLSTIFVLLVVGFLAWAYQAIQPPPAKMCGSMGGPSVTAPRVKLKDGRHLAYKENGVSKDKANNKIVYVHGFDSCRNDVMFFSQELADELGIYLVSFDRAGYGESDPNPRQTLNSTALDIEELADQLGFGSKFYVVGFSLGGQLIWTCLKYIPHRLAGATLIAPAINYWWPRLPANLSKEAFSQLLLQDQWTLRVAHNVPWLTYWWNTQKWFPSLSLIANNKPEVYSSADLELVPHLIARRTYVEQVRQQGEFESLHRDLMIGFSSWEFNPMDLKNTFPNKEGSVHLWQGDEDLIVPATLQRYIAKKLPWIHYHELTGAGHLFPYAGSVSDAILKALLHGV
ncbi:hypothetical protein IFM89_033372 [Coptis chinensis]|uniref:AB hydrolase-1 domain-containing protein n=1 Tax=Coptis chinensis TaxID=261450 RepID=A0A835HIP2_9MAGN|nr:hypothetical protein IFM89_033372 [Coptis chinensis]